MDALLARVVRSGFVEGGHYGMAVALDPDGGVLREAGDIDTPIFPRSANKPVQALAMLRAGLEVTDAQLALACSSHRGEPVHLAMVHELLAGVGLNEDALATPPEYPASATDAAAWRSQGRPPAREGYNCSGKHAAMLATCVINGWPTTGYLDPEHPLQQRVTATIAELAGEQIAAVGVDGCGAPVLAISTRALARTFSRLVTAEPGSPERRIADAMRTWPHLVGGRGSTTTEVMQAVPGLLAKEGAEGVMAAALPSGTAIALKISDGSARARSVVFARWLCDLSGMPLDELSELAAFVAAPVWGAGRPVGELQAVPAETPTADA